MNSCFELDDGKLYLYFTLVELDGQPILFVCKSQTKLYLCLCNAINPSRRYVIGKCNTEIIWRLINQKISITEAFQSCGDEERFYVLQESFEPEFQATSFLWLLYNKELPDNSLLLKTDIMANNLDYYQNRLDLWRGKIEVNSGAL